MTKFAVYFVPKQYSKFYQMGADLVGYDVYTRKPLVSSTTRSDLASYLGVTSFDTAWADNAREYGFHLTIGDAIDLDGSDETKRLDLIATELEDILACFNPSSDFLLTTPPGGPVSFFPSGSRAKKSVVVLRYKANAALQILEALIVARINPLGCGSGYLERLNKPVSEFNPYHTARIRKFYSPTVLDSFTPHFTLLDPCPKLLESPDGRARMQHFLDEKFGHCEVRVDSICLLTKRDGEVSWSIRKEFPLS